MRKPSLSPLPLPRKDMLASSTYKDAPPPEQPLQRKEMLVSNPPRDVPLPGQPLNNRRGFEAVARAREMAMGELPVVRGRGGRGGGPGAVARMDVREVVSERPGWGGRGMDAKVAAISDIIAGDFRDPVPDVSQPPRDDVRPDSAGQRAELVSQLSGMGLEMQSVQMLVEKLPEVSRTVDALLRGVFLPLEGHRTLCTPASSFPRV